MEPQTNVVDTIEEKDVDPYLLTSYNVNDCVRRYPPSKIGGVIIRASTGLGGEGLILLSVTGKEYMMSLT